MIKITNYLMMAALAILALGTAQGIFNAAETCLGIAVLAAGLFANTTE